MPVIVHAGGARCRGQIGPIYIGMYSYVAVGTGLGAGISSRAGVIRVGKT